MCIFTQSILLVEETKIFARWMENGRQALVYSMNIQAKQDLAMVLPLPVPPGSPEDAVHFISLQDYSNFFVDMERGFPELFPIVASLDFPTPAVQAAPLKVHEVGDFEASYVPSHDDWGRLDRRFQLAPEIWEALPAYEDYGFAVFKLNSTPSLRKWLPFSQTTRTKTIHPMAFEFPRRDSKGLFFPTVHVHDGEIHSFANFHHILYCQGDVEDEKRFTEKRLERSEATARNFMNIKRAKGLVMPDTFCFRWPIYGREENQDTLI